MHIDQVDHLVLTVRDIAATCDFYTRVLGMTVVTFDNNRKAIQFGSQRINLHQVGKEFEPKALKPTAGSGDICFITSVPLDQVIEHIRSQQVEIIVGPVPRVGAAGQLTSIYLRDPDGNLIEIANVVT
ncbi:MAG: VOC family protein [Anaerolineae bacterium]|nr:VOC family protein [Anaerolineae bacterium]